MSRHRRATLTDLVLRDNSVEHSASLVVALTSSPSEEADRPVGLTSAPSFYLMS